MSEGFNQKQLDFMMANIINLGKFSYGLQEKREESLINQSGRMLSAYSIAIAILSLFLQKIPQNCTIVLVIGLTISLIFSLLSGWRYKYIGMPDVDAFFEDVYNNTDSYKTQYQFDTQWKYQISILHKGKKRLNDIRVILISASMLSFLASIIFAGILMIF